MSRSERRRDDAEEETHSGGGPHHPAARRPDMWYYLHLSDDLSPQQRRHRISNSRRLCALHARHEIRHGGGPSDVYHHSGQASGIL